MPADTDGATAGYLHSVLADGVRPFYYRSRVRALLGLPEDDGVKVYFARPLPGVGFTYLRPRWMGEVYAPDELLAGSARGPINAIEEFVDLNSLHESAGDAESPKSNFEDWTRPGHVNAGGQSAATADRPLPRNEPVDPDERQGIIGTGSRNEAARHGQDLLAPDSGQPTEAHDMVIPGSTEPSGLTRPSSGVRKPAEAPAPRSGSERPRLPVRVRPTRSEEEMQQELKADLPAQTAKQLVREMDGEEELPGRPPEAAPRRLPRQESRESAERVWTVTAERRADLPVPPGDAFGHTMPAPHRPAAERPPVSEAAPDHPPVEPAPAPVVVVRQVTGPAATPYAFWERRHLSRLRARILR